MKKTLIIICALLFSFQIEAQFSSPSDVTYNSSNKTFYVASQGTKEILAYKNNVKSSFITGLTKPNAILFGTLPLGSGFLVADSNVVKAYTSGGTLLTTITVPGAIELSDIVADAKTQAMYVSDVGRDYIYKITFGSAPFYIPSVSNFVTTGLKNPSSMYFDSTKRSIMLVSMDTNTRIQKLHVDTKSLTTAMKTSINSAYGIDRDDQGNYYVSSWSNNYVYQVNKYLTASKKLFFYNKPAKFFFERTSDYLYFACFGCGKLEQLKIHNFAPDNAVEKCAGDSFDVYKSGFATNYGCYGKDNRFHLQVSDINGSFSKAINVVTIKDTLVPALFRGKVPVGMTSGKYKLRIVSTIPYVESTITKDFIVRAKPNANAYSQDTAYVCVGNTIKLGDNNPGAGISYKWGPSNGLDNDTFPNPIATVTGVKKYEMLAINRITGCKVEDFVVVKSISNPPANFDDTVMLCKGNSVKIGSEKNTSFDYLWSPGKGLNDSTISNPETDVKDSKWFYVTVGSGNCSTKDSVYVKVNSLPEISGWKDTFWKCPEKAITIGGMQNTSYVYKWEPSDFLNKTNVYNPECFAERDKAYELLVRDEKTNCTRQYRTQVMVYNEPIKPVVTELNDTTLTSSQGGDSFVWYKNEVLVSNSNNKKLVTKESGRYQVRVFHKNGCSKISEQFEFKFIDGIIDVLKQKGFEFYPNPVKDYLMVKTNKNWTLVLRDMNGRIVKDLSYTGNFKWELSALNKGLYLLTIELDKEVYQVKINK